MYSKITQHEKDFAHAMSLKLRLNREKKAAEQKERHLIAQAGEFRMTFVRAAISKHPNLTVKEALQMMSELGF